MENVTKMWSCPLPADSPYVKPFRLHYVQNGVEKNWDVLKVHDSVAIVIYNISRKTLVFVKQFRPAVYVSSIKKLQNTDEPNYDLSLYPAKLGITLELCAGIVDKSKSLVEIAQEEILEECGFSVRPERLQEIITFRSGVGVTGSMQTMFYCEVTDNDKLASGGGVDGEIIDVIELTIDQARFLITDGSRINSAPTLLYGVLWFIHNKIPNKCSL